jgi:hypothetical protein
LGAYHTEKNGIKRDGIAASACNILRMCMPRSKLRPIDVKELFELMRDEVAPKKGGKQ